MKLATFSLDVGLLFTQLNIDTVAEIEIDYENF